VFQAWNLVQANTAAVSKVEERTCGGEDLFRPIEDADSRYNESVGQADSEKIPDPDSSYSEIFCPCKGVR
jgi:hypothetical protein